MYRITVTKTHSNGMQSVVAVQFNEDGERGESNARMEFGRFCEYRVERVGEETVDCDEDLYEF